MSAALPAQGAADTSAKIASLIQKTNTALFSFCVSDGRINGLIANVIRAVTGIFGLGELESPILVTLREFIHNAVKANVKRVYFVQKGLDIYNQADYTEGMANFSREAMLHPIDYLPALKENNLRVKVGIQFDGRILTFLVQNNIRMTEQELARVKERIRYAGEVNALADYFNKAYDESEGAGLGLVMNLVLLKNSGIGVENINVYARPDATQFRLTVPMDQVR